MLRVQRRQCETCIFRSDSPLDLDKLLAQIADPRVPGHYKGHRICHHSEDAVCAGFWARHKNDFDLGQVAQRLDMVQLVDDDTIAEEER